MEEENKHTMKLSVVKAYWEQEKERGMPGGDLTLEEYCKEIRMVYRIIDDENDIDSSNWR